VLAHGSIQGFGSEDSGDTDDENPPVPTNRIDLSALPAGEIDYVALGDWHGLKQVGARAWYSGCHEMDRFPRSTDYRSGQVLVVQATRGAMPEAFPVVTGGIQWHQLRHRFNSDEDLERLEQQLRDLIGPRSNQDLLLLELDGSLSLSAAARLQELLQRLEARLLQLTERAGDPLVARVALRLQELVAHGDAERDGAGDGQSELARMALRELHRACVRR